MKTLLTLCVLITLLATGQLTAQVPTTIPIQGHLFQSDGSPVSDGVHEVTVRVISPNTDPSGMIVCDACQVEFVEGVFQLVLGREGMPRFPDVASPMFFELTVDGEVLSPQIEVHSVPFAHEAAHVVQQKASGVPLATILAMAAPPAADDDYLVADGRALSGKEYPDLYAAIGSRWGDGTNDNHDSTNFNLPDLRGLFLRGADMGSGRDAALSDRTTAEGSSVDDGSTGSYQYVESFPVRQEFGQVHSSPRQTRTAPPSSKPVYLTQSLDDARSSTPNAAVVYVIKVR